MHERIRVIDITGLKKIEFAKRSGISAPFVSELCTGAKKPSDRTIADICREFNISENWLRTGEAPAKPREMSDAEYHAELDRQLAKEKKPELYFGANDRSAFFLPPCMMLCGFRKCPVI